MSTRLKIWKAPALHWLRIGKAMKVSYGKALEHQQHGQTWYLLGNVQCTAEKVYQLVFKQFPQPHPLLILRLLLITMATRITSISTTIILTVSSHTVLSPILSARGISALVEWIIKVTTWGGVFTSWCFSQRRCLFSVGDVQHFGKLFYGSAFWHWRKWYIEGIRKHDFGL